MKYYVIAGEASGDLHGSNLLRALKKQDPSATFRCWGGNLMADAGGELVKHYRDLAFMGFVEVLLNLWTILRNIWFCKQDILAYQPDALVLIDYPGFNLRIAKWAKTQNIRVVYYISPQIWAWDERRVHQIKKNVDLMLCILPFEADFYKKYDYPVKFVGHPLLDVIKTVETDRKTVETVEIIEIIEAVGKPIIALLPGSRKQEVVKMLNIMLSVAPQFSGYEFVIAGAPSLETAFYENVMQTYQKDLGVNVRFVQNKTYDLLQEARAALVTSGTATLEVALFGVPQVVCYRTSPISYWLAKRLIRIKYISLVNLIMNQPLVVELIQNELETSRLATELHAILDENRAETLKSGYLHLRSLLGNEGASDRAATAITAFLSEKNN